MYNMECVVDEKSGEVSFLYKFSKGVCSKSFGMNVARMAGLDESIVKKAFQMSHDFEFSFKTGQVMAMFDKLIQKIDADSLEIEDLRSIKLLCANLKNSS